MKVIKTNYLMEFLWTYGWAILVVLFMVLILSQYNFSPDDKKCIMDNTTNSHLGNGYENYTKPNQTIKLNYSGYYLEDSPIIECEQESKIRGSKYWGYGICIRCKDLNRSVWEGVIPAGDWIC